MKDMDRRISKLEGKFEPERRIICVLDSVRNRKLIARGLMPNPPTVRETQHRRCRAKNRRRTKPIRRRLGKRDLVVFMSEVELAL
jgi:uncharacterized Fe-S cluster-containing protein